MPDFSLLLIGSSSFGKFGSPDRHPSIRSRHMMEASFWTTMESYPQQAPLGIINMLISRRTLMDSISRSLEVLYEMPYTTDFPPGLPADLEQILRDPHASWTKLLGRTDCYIVLPCSLLMLYRPNLGFLMTQYYHTFLHPMVRPHLHPGLCRPPKSYLGP